MHGGQGGEAARLLQALRREEGGTTAGGWGLALEVDVVRAAGGGGGGSGGRVGMGRVAPRARDGMEGLAAVWWHRA